MFKRDKHIFETFSARYLNFHGELFRFHEFIKYTEQPKKFCVVFGIIIFVQPDTDYFVVFRLRLLHGKENGANGHIEKENLPISKIIAIGQSCGGQKLDFDW